MSTMGMMNLKNFASILGLAFFVMTGWGCSHGKKSESVSHLSPEERVRADQRILTQICELGAENHRVSGSLWMKTLTDGKGGQFPATVVARAPDQVDLEITNAFGGTEARIHVQGNRYEIHVSEDGSEARGKDHWKGIPLRFAADLFLGRIPCPEPKLRFGAKVVRNQEGQILNVLAGVDRFVYEGDFSDSQSPEVKKLRWEKAGKNVDFVFSSPNKWEIRSPQGEVKVKWTERDIETKMK